MMKTIKTNLLLVLLLSLIACGNKEQQPNGVNAKPVGLLKGYIAPNFSTEDIDGNKIELYSLRGNVVLLDFWASWCPPCRQSIPELLKINNDYKSKNFKMIGISIDYSMEDLKKFLAEKSVNWTQIYDNSYDVNQHYNIDAIPHIYLLNKQGEIIYTGYPDPITLRKLIDEALQQS